MKKFLILILMCFVQNVFSQTIKNDSIMEEPASANSLAFIPNEDNKIYNIAEIEVKPEYPGGTDQLYNFIEKNYKIPEVTGLNGEIYMTFIVEKDGSLNQIKIVTDLGHNTGIEAIRVLKMSPKWRPAELNGKKVRANYSVPILINQ
jgi:hypothetical protein